MIQKMLEAGVHVGHRIQRWNPAMAPFIYGQNYGIHIIDIFKSHSYLCEACEFLAHAKKKRILFVGTKKSASLLIQFAALGSRKQAHYINHRWLGGFLTNWTTMRACITRFNAIEPEKASSKKERLLLDKHKLRLFKFFHGVRTMELKPELLVIVGQQEEIIAVQESHKLNIPNITLVDTDCNPKLATYCIPANDDSFLSIQFILKTLVCAHNFDYDIWG
jgi:small subunit ribosomal protein S2